MQELLRRLIPIVVRVAIESIAPDRSGVYICYRRSLTREGLISALAEIHEFFPAEGRNHPADKLASWKFNSGEKIGRAAVNPNHVSAWQSRDFANGHYGGAIIFFADGFWHGIGASGLTEQGDESVVLTLAVMAGKVNSTFVKRVIGHSDNQNLPPLLMLKVNEIEKSKNLVAVFSKMAAHL